LKIFSLLRGPSLKPAWTFSPAGAIWRLVPSQTGELIIEAREQDTKRATFHALDATSGVAYWQDLMLDEPWWIGIEDVAKGTLLVHKFASPDMPQHLGIIALELRTGMRLWSNDELTYWFSSDDSVFAHRMMFDKRVASELDLHTGHVMKEIGEDFEFGLFQNREEAVQENQKGLQFPEVLDFERSDPIILRVAKKGLHSHQVQGAVEFARFENVVIVSFHTLSGEKSEERTLLDNYLKIMDIENGGLLFSDIISHTVQSAVPDSFFVRNNMLYFIKNQKTLTAIRLSA